MEPTDFLFFVLPLGALIAILVLMVLYLARKEETMHDKEVVMLNELLLSGIIDKENFASALNRLLQDNIIDQDTYERLGKLLEVAYK